MSDRKLKIAVLAVQGAFIEHEKMLEGLGAECAELRCRNDCLQDFDGIVLPGGESTVQNKLLRELEMYEILKEKIENDLPVLATCAGMILLADKISGSDMRCFGTLPVMVRRNAYGRQLGSFSNTYDIAGIGPFEARFIRAPFVESVHGGDAVSVLARADDRIIAVRYKNQLAFAFHPELTNDPRIHREFLQLC